MDNSVSRSWFAVFNNPANHGYEGTPEEVCHRLRDEWIKDNPTRSGGASKIRSKTFPGIARAMAEQWGSPNHEKQLSFF